MMKVLFVLLCIGAALGLGACNSKKAEVPAAGAVEGPGVEILIARIEPLAGDKVDLGNLADLQSAASQPFEKLDLAALERLAKVQGEPKYTVTIKGPSGLKFKKATIVAEGEDDGSFTAYVTIDEFPAEIGGSLVVKVKDKVFVPRGYGGNSKAYWSLDLRNVERKYAEVLNGGPLPRAPKERFAIEFLSFKETYEASGPVVVGLWIKNVGDVATTIYWGTHGGGNYRCRDTQLSFTATLKGEPVPGVAKPLPDGFISSPHVAQPNTYLKRTVDLSEWLEFRVSGDYVVDAAYKLEIENPQKGGAPSRWTVTYHKQFVLKVRQ